LEAALAVNDGIGNPVQDPFPGIAIPGSTGADGSPGDTSSQTTGVIIGSPVVSAVYESTQAEPLPRVDVLTGDTSGASSDSPVGDNFTELSGVQAGDMLKTGAGEGGYEFIKRGS
jgi:hypothetical protein